MSPHQTALNGRPGAVKASGGGRLVRATKCVNVSTPDGPK